MYRFVFILNISTFPLFLPFVFLGIEDLCAKRDELQRVILIEEEEKHNLLRLL